MINTSHVMKRGTKDAPTPMDSIFKTNKIDPCASYNSVFEFLMFIVS